MGSHIGAALLSMTAVGLLGLIILNPKLFTDAFTLLTGVVRNSFRFASGNVQ